MFNLFRGPRTEALSLADAVRQAQTGALTLIDVREAAEVAQTGKAKGALHIPLAMVPLKCDPRGGALPKGLSVEKPVGVYCASGGRSGRTSPLTRSCFRRWPNHCRKQSTDRPNPSSDFS